MRPLGGGSGQGLSRVRPARQAPSDSPLGHHLENKNCPSNPKVLRHKSSLKPLHLGGAGGFCAGMCLAQLCPGAVCSAEWQKVFALVILLREPHQLLLDLLSVLRTVNQPAFVVASHSGACQVRSSRGRKFPP